MPKARTPVEYGSPVLSKFSGETYLATEVDFFPRSAKTIAKSGIGTATPVTRGAETLYLYLDSRPRGEDKPYRDALAAAAASGERVPRKRTAPEPEPTRFAVVETGDRGSYRVALPPAADVAAAEAILARAAFAA